MFIVGVLVILVGIVGIMLREKIDATPFLFLCAIGMALVLEAFGSYLK